MIADSVLETYRDLSSSEQDLFRDSLRLLMAEGLVHRGIPEHSRVYSFLRRRESLVREYLSIAGWELRFAERQETFHLQHLTGAHREKLDGSTTKWLLLLRLLYAEKREGRGLDLTRNPSVTLEELAQRYSEYFPNEKFKTRMSDALTTLQTWNLLRWHKVEDVLELLPTLEVIVPASGLEEAANKLRELQKPSEDDE
jgi:Domain of unknown function (DUF4194)